MLNPAIQIIETRLHAWKQFFETGRETIHSPIEGTANDLDIITMDVIETGDPDLIDLAELVDLMAQNYILKADNELHAAMMHDDDDAPYVPTVRTGPPALSKEELDAALAGVPFTNGKN